jgi:hypothetical protein
MTVEPHRSFCDWRFQRWLGGFLRFHYSITLVAARLSRRFVVQPHWRRMSEDRVAVGNGEVLDEPNALAGLYKRTSSAG